VKPLQTDKEAGVGPALATTFETSADSISDRLECFPRYARRKSITRFLALYELFKLAQGVKGSIVECGVFRGFGLMSWAHFSAVLEPANLTRRVYGFDTFEGFPSIAEKDANSRRMPKTGELRSASHDELQRLIQIYDDDRFLGHVDKVHLIKGDVVETIPRFVEQNQHLVVSLLFLDFDLYEPTRIALQQFLPRMPKGAILAFDELDNPIWPGETAALLETAGIGNMQLRRLEFDPYISFATL